MLLMRYPGGKAKAVTLSYDDGITQDIKLMQIMKKHGIKGTFNINGGLFPDKDSDVGKMSAAQVKKLYSDSGNEVALHCYSHAHLEDLSYDMIRAEIMKDRLAIEKIFGTIVRGMAYPYGTFNDEVIRCAKSCGIIYSRTTISTESFSLPHEWLKFNPTCHHNNPNLFDLVKNFLSDKRSDYSDPCTLFYLWGHSYEFDRDNNWDRIEKFADMIGGHDDIWYAANIEICEYVKAYRSLIFSADGMTVKNPTSVCVWVVNNEKLTEIKPGETVYFSE